MLSSIINGTKPKCRHFLRQLADRPCRFRPETDGCVQNQNETQQYPLTKYMFSKQISMVYPIDTFRPHKSRDSYPYYFKGIDIDKEKYKAFKSGK